MKKGGKEKRGKCKGKRRKDRGEVEVTTVNKCKRGKNKV
jgi:hypothetical protein